MFVFVLATLWKGAATDDDQLFPRDFGDAHGYKAATQPGAKDDRSVPSRPPLRPPRILKMLLKTLREERNLKSNAYRGGWNPQGTEIFKQLEAVSGWKGKSHTPAPREARKVHPDTGDPPPDITSDLPRQLRAADAAPAPAPDSKSKNPLCYVPIIIAAVAIMCLVAVASWCRNAKRAKRGSFVDASPQRPERVWTRPAKWAPELDRISEFPHEAELSKSESCESWGHDMSQDI